MKIIHEESGLTYQLEADTRLEIERPNMFFSEYCEQSLPVELPDTPRNRRLTGYADQVANVSRPRTDIPCTIEDGSFRAHCRQAVLGAKKGECITTSFYLSESLLSEKMSKTNIKEVFGNENIPGVNTLDEAINYCRRLLYNKDPNFTIFPVALEENGLNFAGGMTYKVLNDFGYMERDYGYNVDYFYRGKKEWEDYVFYNETNRTETFDGQTIRVGRGFYISPFIRANYLMKRLFAYFGYELEDSLFDQNKGFQNMVFVNRCADSIIDGVIRIADLCPDRTCAEILDVYRKMFLCEFRIDQESKKATVVFLKDLLKSCPTTDLSSYMSGNPEISAPESYKRITLSVESSEQSTLFPSTSIDVNKVRLNYPTACYSNVAGCYYRNQYTFSYNEYSGKCSMSLSKDRLASGLTNYDNGDDMDEDNITIPIHQPGIVRNYYGNYYMFDIIVGKAIFLNSHIAMDGYESDEDMEDANGNSQSESIEQPVILAYDACPEDGQQPIGSLTYGCMFKFLGAEIEYGYLPVEDTYSLFPCGETGLYERFYKELDLLKRNSLWEVNVNLRIPELTKSSLPAYEPVLLQGQKFLIDTFRYIIGGKGNEETETTLLTTQIYEPVIDVPSFSEIFSPKGEYRWQSYTLTTRVSQQEYESSPYRDKAIPVLYPDLPDEKYCDGKRHYERTTIRVLKAGNGIAKMTSWLECLKADK